MSISLRLLKGAKNENPDFSPPSIASLPPDFVAGILHYKAAGDGWTYPDEEFFKVQLGSEIWYHAYRKPFADKGPASIWTQDAEEAERAYQGYIAEREAEKASRRAGKTSEESLQDLIGELDKFTFEKGSSYWVHAVNLTSRILFYIERDDLPPLLFLSPFSVWGEHFYRESETGDPEDGGIVPMKDVFDAAVAWVRSVESKGLTEDLAGSAD